MKKKPKCELIGQDGNIFNLLGKASKVLPKKTAQEMRDKVYQCKSYDDALSIISEYVEII